MTASDRQYANRILSNAERYGALHPIQKPKEGVKG